MLFDDHTVIELLIVGILAVIGWWQRRLVTRLDKLDETKANKKSTDERFNHLERQHEQLGHLISDVRACLSRIEGKVDAACK